jgi:hypothetical protein
VAVAPSNKTRIAIAKQWQTSPHPIIFHGNGSHLDFFQSVKSFHKLTAAILKLNISVCKSACDKKHYCKVS